MQSRLAKTVALAMAVLTFAGATAGAQTDSSTGQKPLPRASAIEDEQRSIYTIQVENDVFNRFGTTDRDYTSGVRLGWLSPALTEMKPGLVSLTTIPTFFGEAAADSVIRRFALSFGQNIYTPENTWAAYPVYNDRPYAAWAYAGFALQYTYKRRDEKTGRDEPMRLDTLQLDVGVIGPAAQGEFVQNNFHTLIGVAQSYGWAHQLHNEPTIGLTFERRWRTGRVVLIEDPKREVDFIPRMGSSLGNVSTYTGAGGTARHGSARTCARISARRAPGRRGRGRRPSSATAASAGTCSPSSTARPWRATFSSTATPREQPAGVPSPVRRRAPGRARHPLSGRTLLLHPGAAHAGVLRARPHHAVRLAQPDVWVLK